MSFAVEQGDDPHGLITTALDRTPYKYSRAPVINREAAAYWIPAFAGMTVVCREAQCRTLTPLTRKILRLQFDRRTMWRAIAGAVPGIAIAMQGFGRCNAFRGDEFLQGREPMPVVGLAGVGIA